MKDKNKAASARKLIFVSVSTLLMVLYAQYVLGYFSGCFSIEGYSNSLGLSFGYNSFDVLRFFELRTEQQLLCYSDFLMIWDTIFPLVYTLMYISWLIFLFRQWYFYSIIPVVHMILDWAENYFEISLIKVYLETDEISNQLITLGSSFTQLKWIISFFTYGILIFGVVQKLKKHISKPKNLNE